MFLYFSIFFTINLLYFFSPGDYKKEELYIDSIGTTRQYGIFDSRVKNLEDTLVVLQDFLETAKVESSAKVDFSEVRRSIHRQQEFELNPLYAFITNELRVDHQLAQKMIASATDAWELPKLIESELNDRRKAARLTGLITSFQSVESDFCKIKHSTAFPILSLGAPM